MLGVAARNRKRRGESMANQAYGEMETAIFQDFVAELAVTRPVSAKIVEVLLEAGDHDLWFGTADARYAAEILLRITDEVSRGMTCQA